MDVLSKLGQMLVVFSQEHKDCINCGREWNDIRELLKSDRDLQTLLSINWQLKRVAIEQP
jgi:hypothetical protein